MILNSPYQCAQPAFQRVHHAVSGLERLLQLVGMNPLVGQRLLDLLQSDHHFRICIVDVILQVSRLKGIIGVGGGLPATLLIRLQHESLTAAADIGSWSIHALLIARFLCMALVDVLFAVTTRITSRTATSVGSRAVSAVLTADGANSCNEKSVKFFSK